MAQNEYSNAVKSPGSLRKRITQGGQLFVAGFGISQILRLGSNLILTRLLMPEAFGLMATVIAFNVLAVMITDLGVSSSIVRSSNSDNPAFLRTAWTMNILRNSVIWALVNLLAVAVMALANSGLSLPDSTFADPLLPWLMACTAFQLIIAGLESVNKVMAERRLEMRRLLPVEIGTQIVSSIVTISAAFSGFGVWSFVFGILSGATFSSICSHMAFLFPGPRMKLCLERSFVFEILNFGKWLIIASFFGFMTNKGDHMIFGWVMESSRFGLYAVASIWITVAFMFSESITRRLFYPAFSEILRDRPDAIANAYRQGRLAVDALAVLIVLGVLFFSDIVFEWIYPAAFGGVAYYVKLLSPVILLYPYRMLNYVILSSGNSKSFTFVTLITGISTLAIVPMAVSAFGEDMGIIFFACAAAAGLPVAWRIASKVMPIDWLAEARMVTACAVVVAVLVVMGPESAIIR